MSDKTMARNVMCFPLAGILKAIKVSYIDYFSLDVEGDELAILKTINFKRFDIKVSTIIKMTN